MNLNATGRWLGWMAIAVLAVWLMFVAGGGLVFRGPWAATGTLLIGLALIAQFGRTDDDSGRP